MGVKGFREVISSICLAEKAGCFFFFALFSLVRVI